MDWGRAKNVLILSFLILNVLLGYQLWIHRGDMGDRMEDENSAAEELNRLMELKNIGLISEIPKQVPRMKEITVSMTRVPEKGEVQLFETPIPYHAWINEERIKDQLAKAVPNIELYEFDPVQTQNGVLAMYQMHRDMPLFDVRLELMVDGNNIVGYRQIHAEEIASEEGTEEHKVLPAYTVLKVLVENHLFSGTKITDVRLGYHGQMYDSEKQVLAPYWRVAVSGGDMYYIHAINGAVEAPQKRGETEHAF